MTVTKMVQRPSLNPNIRTLKQSPIRELTKLLEQARNDPEVISFGGGQPSFPPPKFVMEKEVEYFKQSRSHRYSSTPGNEELRDGIAKMMLREEGWEYLEASNILVTQSATNGLEAAVTTLAREGDEAILVSPVYPGIIGVLATHGIRYRILETHVWDGFRLDLGRLNESIVEGKTKMLIVISPDNPTGRILSEAEVKAIGDMAQDNGIAVLCDESYYRIVYDGSFAPFKEYLPNLVGVRSFSKTASATGWRIGYNYSGPEIMESMEKVNQFRTLCVTPFFQQLISEFVMNHTEREDYLRKVLDEYKVRRDAMTEGLRRWMPLAKFTIPQAGFYHFIRLPGISSDDAFSREVFSETKVAMVPGSAFGRSLDEGYFRLTFVSEPPARIDEGIRRIADYVAENVEKPRITGAGY